MKGLLRSLLPVVGLVLLATGCSSSAQFEVGDLAVQPSETMEGEKMTVSINVRNNGEKAGSHLLTLRLNGEVVETREVQVEAEATELVAFEVITQAPGSYQVELGGLSGSFTVTLGAAQIIAKASERIAGVRSFHFVLEHEGAGTPLSAGLEMLRAEGDVVRPDRLRATIDGLALGMPVQVDVVLIGDTVYITNPLPPGNWQSFSSGMSPVGFFDPQTGVAALLGDVADLTPLGESEMEGKTAYHISGRVPAAALEAITGSSVPGAEVEVELWVGKQDFHLLQAKLTGKITTAESAGMVRWLRFSHFNQASPIEPPL
ncbi:MAG: LppX_LprAFG lipoprotein [Dehalococcoidia bacterium]|nr:LppX_LprAFG lipoprotein [Dehalococcoidia bacterium]MDP6783269.1 LppX_LprAFG lipoprotein [Dehalococcoidia bacterium]